MSEAPKDPRRLALEEIYGQVWSRAEFDAAFEIRGFMQPWVNCKRRADGQEGSVRVTQDLAFFMDFRPD